MYQHDEYENRLRKIVLRSADVLKNEIAEYLKKVADSHDSKLIEQVLKSSHDLVEHIPKELVNFITDVLIWKPSCPVRPKNNFEVIVRYAQTNSFDPKVLFGIRLDWDYKLFDPPAHFHSPFFHLLSKNETAGLNLVHGLTNAATDRWRESFNDYENISTSKQDCTILPIIINLTSGIHRFWGDDEVYCWYRGIINNTSKAVTSALMALEFWMEKQIESGREPENLFETVLSKSNSVATIAVCLSITLAHPQKCLNAALPFVSNPALWRMDIQRYGGDMGGRFKIPFLEKDWIYDILKEHDQKPHRKLNIYSLAPLYLFTTNDSLSIKFEQAVELFTENLPFQYLEDVNNSVVVNTLQKEMQSLQFYCKRENYKIYKTEIGYYPQINLSEAIQQSNEEDISFSPQYQQLLRMQMWASEFIKTTEEKGKAPLEDISEMIGLAQEFYQPTDFTLEKLENFNDNNRLATIAIVVAASLISNCKWIIEQNLLEWSKRILLLAARSICPSVDTTPLNKFNVSAAHGLAALVEDGLANLEIRQEIVQLIGKASRRFGFREKEVIKIIFGRLHKAWSIEPILCWNILSLGISLSVIPSNLSYGSPDGEYGTNYDELENWENNLIQNHMNFVKKEIIPKLPRIPIQKDFDISYGQIQYCLYALPLNDLCQDIMIKNKFLNLCDELIARTINDNLPTKHNRYSKPYEWNYFIFDWVAYFANSLNIEEIRHHILKPISDNWTETPELLANLMNGYISHQIAYIEKPSNKSIEVWKEMCEMVLDSLKNPQNVSRDYFDSDTMKILQLIIFTYRYDSRIKSDWQHAHLFTDIFDKWVSTVGHIPEAYRHLIIMLNGIGWQFAPKKSLDWLTQCTKNSDHNLWSKNLVNPQETAALLNRIWNTYEKQVRRDKDSLQQYSNLVDSLVVAGIPLASILQEKLEKSKKT